MRAPISTRSGVTLFEMLSGRPPFEADSAMTLMMMHLNDPVPDLEQLHPGHPRGRARDCEPCAGEGPR